MATTTSWLNITLSIERVFASLLPDVTRYRMALPTDEGQRRSLVGTGQALFFTLTQGAIDRWQDTYCSLWLCEGKTTSRDYTPLTNYQGVWLQQTALTLQQELNTGGTTSWHLFPIYNYERRVPPALLAAFLSDGDVAPITPYLTAAAPKIEQTGFVVRAGSGRPSFILDRNPSVFEFSCVFQHWNPEVWAGQRG